MMERTKPIQDQEVYQVSIHHQQCPRCGAIGSIQRGMCGSCAARVQLVNLTPEQVQNQNVMQMPKAPTKNIDPKFKLTAADIMGKVKALDKVATENPIDAMRNDDAEGITFVEDAPQLSEEQYSISILKQIKAAVVQNATLLQKFYSSITIDFRVVPPKFVVAKKPKEIEI
jgi:hypothetical protein